MTRVTIIGENENVKKLKSIEFTHYLNGDMSIIKDEVMPSKYDNIELICKYNTNFDLMYAYGRDRNNGTLFMGHFNDGIV